LFAKVYEIFKDGLGLSGADAINRVLREYHDDPHKTLYGYCMADGSIAGLAGVVHSDKGVELAHFAMASAYRGGGAEQELRAFLDATPGGLL
jgi:hypothetical protein